MPLLGGVVLSALLVSTIDGHRLPGPTSRAVHSAQIAELEDVIDRYNALVSECYATPACINAESSTASSSSLARQVVRDLHGQGRHPQAVWRVERTDLVAASAIGEDNVEVLTREVWGVSTGEVPAPSGAPRHRFAHFRYRLMRQEGRWVVFAWDPIDEESVDVALQSPPPGYNEPHLASPPWVVAVLALAVLWWVVASWRQVGPSRGFAFVLAGAGLSMVLALGLWLYGYSVRGEVYVAQGERTARWHDADLSPWVDDFPPEVEWLESGGDRVALRVGGEGGELTNGQADIGDWSVELLGRDRAPRLVVEAGGAGSTALVKVSPSQERASSLRMDGLPFRFYVSGSEGDRWRIRIQRQKISVLDTELSVGDSVDAAGLRISLLDGPPWARLALRRRPPVFALWVTVFLGGLALAWGPLLRLRTVRNSATEIERRERESVVV